MTVLRTILFISLFGACHPTAAPTTSPVPQTILARGQQGPDRIPCDTPVVISATSDQSGVQEEREWLNAHYPGHGRYKQGLYTKGNRAFDVLEFTTPEGRSISVCFDITSSFGHY